MSRSGLRKAKKYDWKDSNLALFGSDLEKNVKKESAEGEPAWKGAGESVGLQIWRIVKFKVTHWKKEDYGKFYNGDSYIVLRTFKKDPDSEELSYDVHFWIGKESTQDEYGTAAYKTVELDHFLSDKPIQHREVQGHESDMFKSYFRTFVIMKGGTDSGFNRVQPEEYKPRLFHVKAEKKETFVSQKSLKRASMNNNDVFIIDLGLTICQWNGIEARHSEKFKARSFIAELEKERHGKAKSIVLDEQTVENFNPRLQSVIPDGKAKKVKEVKAPIEKKLFKLSDASGRLRFIKVEQSIDRSKLDTKDVFILDTEGHCFVWSGAKASINERRKAMQFAHEYLRSCDHPFSPISCIKEGKESSQFISALN